MPPQLHQRPLPERRPGPHLQARDPLPLHRPPPDLDKDEDEEAQPDEHKRVPVADDQGI